ncbi:hypothetical protein ACR30T_04955 [Neisseria gonorrhoeae]
MQADLAYAYEHITRDYPEATGANQGKISTVSDYFKNIRTRSVHPRLALGYDFGGWRVFSAPAVAAGLTNPFNITDPAIAADSVKSINSAESRLFPKNLDAAG